MYVSTHLAPDSDMDGLTYLEEYTLSPNCSAEADTDGDGVTTEKNSSTGTRRVGPRRTKRSPFSSRRKWTATARWMARKSRVAVSMNLLGGDGCEIENQKN